MKLKKFLRNKFFTPTRKLQVYLNDYLIYKGHQRGTKNNQILRIYKECEVIKVNAHIREWVVFI